MSYVKNTWVDQQGQVRYAESADGDYIILTPNFDNVTELGTPVNATNMNHIENGIYDCDTAITDLQANKANKNGSSSQTFAVANPSNNTDAVNKRTLQAAADGKWQNLNQVVLDNSNLKNSSGTPLLKTVDIPNDGQIYDVLFSVSVETGSNSGDAIYVNIKGNVLSGTLQVAGCRTRANNYVGSRGCTILPLKYASGNLSITRTSSMEGKATITAVAYRRNGTNT